MNKKKKEILESKGYKVGSVDEFLGLSKEEAQYIELKLALSQALVERRKKSKLTQAQLAKMLKSSQSRVAKMERGDLYSFLREYLQSIPGRFDDRSGRRGSRGAVGHGFGGEHGASPKGR